jgi:molybdate transport system permease protein
VDWTALWLSVRLAAATTLVLLAIGIPIAYWLVYSPRRWKVLVEAVVALPLVLPPTVLGFYVLVAIGPYSPFGRAYARLAGHGLPFTFEGLLIASVLYSLPFAVQPFAAEFASVDRRLLEASWTLGASRLATFRRIVIPLSVRGLVTGIVLSFAHTLAPSASSGSCSWSAAICPASRERCRSRFTIRSSRSTTRRRRGPPCCC